MKQRFSSLDVKVIAHELSKSLVPLRVTNIYDLSSRIFLIKFHKPDHREQLIVESGFRCHLTSYARTTASAPSGFVARLRKYLKTRRVTKISQVGTDRIIEFEFSDGLYKLYFEFYAGGNIVLTDGDLKILALLRNVEEGAEHERLRVGLEYNLSLRQNYEGIPELTKERVRDGLQKSVDRQQEAAPTGKKAKKATKDALRKALATSITECPPLLVDHAMHQANFDSTLKPEQVLEDEALLEKLVEALKNARQMSDAITEPDTVKGYILAKPNPAAPKAETEGESSEKSNYVYDDFHPFRPQQFENGDYTFLEFDGFNKAVDEFFSSIEGQKLEGKLHEREMAAKKKLEAARKEHSNRIGGLQQVQELNFRKAEAILANVHRVTEAMDAVNGLLGKGMDWGEMARLIEREQNQGNAVAQTIQLPLKLYENTVTLLLDESNPDQTQEDDSEGNETSSVSEDTDDEDTAPSASKKPSKRPQPAATPKLAIDINLGLSAYKNSTEYFEQKKVAADKEGRTIESSDKALKNRERKVAEDLKKGLKQEKEVLRPVRKQHWFEKFVYFISSDGYLVLGGKDAQQQEILYRRWLKKGDIYIHADLKGAIPMIIKNNPNTPDAPIPPSTLSQAGNLCVSTSEAWDNKAVMSAWWVRSDQLSKTDQTGEFLAPGMFNIKGKKEFLPPAQLIVGLGVMFEISEESKARHRKHRVVDGPVDTEADAIKEEQQKPAKEASDSESEEDFPDAKIGSDSDDDFPDAKLEEESEGSDEDSDSGKQNPLQSGNADKGNDSDADSDEELEETPEKKTASPVTKPQSTQENEDEDAGTVADSEQPKSKPGPRHLSARERRLLRKGQPLDVITPTPESDPTTENNAPDESTDAQPSSKGPPSVTTQQTSKTGASAKPLPRGKRAKAKKLAAKYANQDEEDRELAMRLLGSQTGQKAAEEEANERRKKEEEAARNKQRRREQHLKVQEKGKKEEDARRAALENEDNSGGEGSAEDDKKKLDLEAFTGYPLPGDEILSAIPVCAPWSALAKYKYKVKLQPGATKRGKAVKEILMKWDIVGKDPKALDKESKDKERIWPREIELIRGWRDVEVVGAIPVSKVRVMMGGGGGGSAAGAGKNGKGGKKGQRGNRGSKKK